VRQSRGDAEQAAEAVRARIDWKYLLDLDMVHLTGTCDGDAPHLVVHADTTAGNVHEAMRTKPIHAALAAKGLPPATHLADAAYTPTWRTPPTLVRHTFSRRARRSTSTSSAQPGRI
jgi:hypothetical protein